MNAKRHRMLSTKTGLLNILDFENRESCFAMGIALAVSNYRSSCDTTSVFDRFHCHLNHSVKPEVVFPIFCCPVLMSLCEL